MNLLVSIYQRKQNARFIWTTLNGEEEVCEGRSTAKIRSQLTQTLKKKVSEMTAAEVLPMCGVASVRLVRCALEMTLRGASRRQVSGKFPVIVEPRWTSEEDKVLVCYHPSRRSEWFPCPDEDQLREFAGLFFREAWQDLSDAELADLRTDSRDSLKVLAFDATPLSIERELQDQPKGIWADLEATPDKKNAPIALTELPKIGSDLTPAAIEGSLAVGRPRAAYRAQLQRWLGAVDKRSVVVLGPPGAGKTTVINRLVADLLEGDDYHSHLNLDRVHHVWRIAGRRLIAGMSHVGDWERRCGDLLQEMQGRKVILFVEDISAFGRIGQSRDSERSLADYFRGPVARGEVTMIAESSPEAFAHLEEEAPAFAALFARMDIRATTREETYQLMFHEARALELKHGTVFEVNTYRSVMELTDALYPGAAFPGKALNVLRALAQGNKTVGEKDVVAHLSGRTGLASDLLRPEGALLPAAVSERFSRRVMGQPEAVAAATDLSMRVREGLTDPSRPYAVMLLTGPTGTGKTEMAKAIAVLQYGSLARLVRIDMSEMAGSDGPSRLMGHRFAPDGMLTKPVQEQPFCVVLLDEIEKAHPSVLNLLLQLFDEGRLTDAAGRVADFRRAVVIMTSNLGARQRAPVGFDEAPEARAQDVAKAVREFFPPELFNRIDQIVPFRSLDAEVARQVADKALAELVARPGLASRNVYVATTQAVLDRVVAEGFDAEHGARTVKRYLEDRVARLLTETLTRDRPAQMRTLTLYSVPAGLRIHEEALRECEPAPVTLLMDGLRTSDRAPMLAYYNEVCGELRQLVTDRIGIVRTEVSRRVTGHTQGSQEDDLDVLQRLLTELEPHADTPSVGAQRADHWDEYEDWDGQGALPREMAAPRPPGKRGRFEAEVASGPRLAAESARLHVLSRECQNIGQVGRHGVRLDIRHVGPIQASSDVRGLVQNYQSMWGLEVLRSAARFANGSCRATDGRLDLSLGEQPVHVVLELVGIGLKDRLRFESGTHAYHTLAEDSRLAVVAVETIDGQAPQQILDDHLGARRAFEAALEEAQSDLPTNPDRLLPLVRSVLCRPSDDPSVPDAYEIEDFRLQTSIELRASSLAEAHGGLWLLIESSEDQ